MTEQDARTLLEAELKKLPAYNEDGIQYDRIIGRRIEEGIKTFSGEVVNAEADVYYFAVHLLPRGVGLSELSEVERNESADLWYVDTKGKAGVTEA